MIKEINYFTDPEIIKQYQNSDYEDERHYAVSRFLAAIGYPTESRDELEFKLILRMILLCNIAPSKMSTGHQEVKVDIEQLHFEYSTMILFTLLKVVSSNIDLHEDIVEVALETAKTAEYIVGLFWGM